MKICLAILLGIFINLHTFSQPYQIGYTIVNFIDTTRNNRTVPTEIYYPADAPGSNVPVTTATNDKFPVISFGHGFVMTWDAYLNIWEAVVPEGFIVAFPKTEGGLAPSHTEFAKDMAFVISELSAMDMDSSTIFYNRIDSMNCIMGHSMGGGCALLAAQYSTKVKSLATLAAAETTPSAIQAARGLSIPSLIIAGGNDCVTPPPAHQVPMYDSLQSPCKTFISINGGSHCQMADNNFLCNVGEATCNPPPAITRAEQHILINRYLIPWLKYQLKDDCLAGVQFDSLLTIDTSIVFQKTCALCNTTSLNEHSTTFPIEIFPNPFDDKIFIQCNSSQNNILDVDLYSMNGSRVYSRSIPITKENEIYELGLKEILNSGIYLLKVSDGQQQSVMKVIWRK